jgi:hypothetical protein
MSRLAQIDGNGRVFGFGMRALSVSTSYSELEQSLNIYTEGERSSLAIGELPMTAQH